MGAEVPLWTVVSATSLEGVDDTSRQVRLLAVISDEVRSTRSGGAEGGFCYRIV